MTWPSQYPRLTEVVVSAAILAGSYLGARVLSLLFGKVLARAARRTATTLDDRLVSALERPLAYSIFLVGIYAAIHRLPVSERWVARLEGMLFVWGAALAALALNRAYDILLGWYTTSRAGEGEPLAREFGPLFSKAGRVFIVAAAAIAVFQHFGVNVSSLVLSLGVGSLAVGLAAQDTLANMFAGFTLMLDRPFILGDRIQLASGEVGDVETIGIRATRIKTLDETLLVVPNSLLIKERVVNLTRPTRQLTTRIEVGVAYGSDLAAVKRILSEAALASGYVAPDRPPAVIVTRFADFSVNVLVIFWVRDYVEQGLARSQVHEEIYRRLAEAGIEIPFPVRRIIHEGTALAAAGSE